MTIDKEDKQIRKKIYVVTTFEKVDKGGKFPDYGAIRPVGWFSTHKDAVDTVLQNICDIFECLYDYAVVETLDEGLYPIGEGDYKAEYFKWNLKENKYERIDASEVEIPGIAQAWSIG